jgi:hypothetical protein
LNSLLHAQKLEMGKAEVAAAEPPHTDNNNNNSASAKVSGV